MDKISKSKQNHQEILSMEELCEYLKLTKSTLYKLTQRGEIPSSRIGRQLRFRQTKIQEWLDKRERDYIRRKKNAR